MAWYDGMSFERVDAEIQLGRAPAVDSEVLVPPGWVAWWAERGSWLLAGVRVREGVSCRACGRLLPLDCCSDCGPEPLCEPCLAQLDFIVRCSVDFIAECAGLRREAPGPVGQPD